MGRVNESAPCDVNVEIKREAVESSNLESEIKTVNSSIIIIQKVYKETL